MILIWVLIQWFPLSFCTISVVTKYHLIHSRCYFHSTILNLYLFKSCERGLKYVNKAIFKNNKTRFLFWWSFHTLLSFCVKALLIQYDPVRLSHSLLNLWLCNYLSSVIVRHHHCIQNSQNRKWIWKWF